MRMLGVDPGIHDGLAIVKIVDGAAPHVIDAIDVPVAGVGAKERVDIPSARDWNKREEALRGLHGPMIERAWCLFSRS
jgi:hypothetical protein